MKNSPGSSPGGWLRRSPLTSPLVAGRKPGFAFIKMSAEATPRVASSHRPLSRNAGVQHPLLSAALALGFLVLIAGGWTYQHLRATEREHVAEQLAAIADLKAAQIQNWRAERLQDAVMIRQMPQLLTEALELRASPGSTQARQLLRNWANSIQGGGQYSEVMIYGIAGDLLAATPGAIAKPHPIPQLQAFIRQSLDRGGPFLTDPHRPAPDEPIHLDLLVPLYAPAAPGGQTGEAIAIVVLRIDAEQTFYPLVSRWPVPSMTAEALIVTPVGDEVLALSGLRFRANAAFEYRVPIKTSSTPAARAARGEKGIVESNDYRGEPVIAGVRAIADTAWFLVVKIDQAEAYHTTRVQLAGLLAIVLLLLLAVALVVRAALRQAHADRLKKEVGDRAKAEQAARVAGSRLRTYLDQAADAHFVHDGEGRIHDVNAESCRMLGYNREELLRMTVSDVDADFNPEAAKEAMRQMQPGIPFTIATRHRRKDGGIVPVEVRFSVFDLENRRLYLAQARDVTERLRAETALREGEQRLRAYLDQGSDAFYVNDAAGRLVEVNAEACRVLGYTRGELLGMSVGMVDMDFRPEMAEVGRREIQPGTSRTVPGHHRRKDGSTFPVEVRVGCFDLGGVRFYMAQARDVTDRRRAEGVLRESEARLRTYLDQAGDAIYVNDDTGKFLDVNIEACRMLGYDRDELKQLGATDIDADYAPERIREILAVLMPGEPITRESRHRRKDGGTFPVEVRVGCFDLQGRRYFITHARDITSRKQAEAALRSSEEKFRGLVESSFDFIWEVDPQGRYTYASPQVQSILGYSPEEMLGRTPFDFMTELEAKRVGTAFLNLIEERKPLVALENVNRSRSGGNVVLETNGSPVLGPDGALLGYRGIDRDVTARKRAEQALRDANLRLEYEVAVRTRELAGERTRLQHVFDSIPLAVMLLAVQTNGRITRMVNETYLRLCGITRAQAADPAVLARLTHPDDRAEEAAKLALAEKGELAEFTLEKRIVRADGSVVPVLARFQRRTGSDRSREDLTILTELPPRG